MASWSCTDVREKITRSIPSRMPLSRTERILERLLDQNFNVALNRLCNLVASTSLRPSLSDSLVTADTSDHGPLRKTTNAFPSIKPKMPYWKLEKARRKLGRPRHKAVDVLSNHVASVSLKQRSRLFRVNTPRPFKTMRSVHCKRGIKHDARERYMRIRAVRSKRQVRRPLHNAITYVLSLAGPVVGLEDDGFDLKFPLIPAEKSQRPTRELSEIGYIHPKRDTDASYVEPSLALSQPLSAVIPAVDVTVDSMFIDTDGSQTKWNESKEAQKPVQAPNKRRNRRR